MSAASSYFAFSTHYTAYKFCFLFFCPPYTAQQGRTIPKASFWFAISLIKAQKERNVVLKEISSKLDGIKISKKEE